MFGGPEAVASFRGPLAAMGALASATGTRRLGGKPGTAASELHLSERRGILRGL